jgi:membrane protease YdiL (CAAX protease family)
MSGSRTLLWLALAMTIGWAEEVLFRGVVHQFIGGWGLMTVLLSAVLFGLPHAVSVGAGVGELLANAFTVTMVVGVPFAALRERGLGLAPLIVLHGLIDVVAFLGTDSLGVLDASNQMLIAQSVISAVIGTCWLVWFSLRRPKARDAK